MLIFSLASVVVELLEISPFFSKYKMKNISGTHLANCPQKQAADLALISILPLLWNGLLKKE
jgi:hypothetical protein